jgi:hypothetical protein
MVLIERYLHAVSGHLPAKDRDDIIAELDDDIRAQVEERKKALKRALTEDAEAEILQPYGRPLLLAARYWPKRYLIGPSVFPFYWTTLKLALAVAFVVHVAVVVGLAIAGRPLGQAAESLWSFPTGAALTIFFWVTIVFAIFDFALGRVKVGEKWDPHKLPRVTAPAPRASRLEVGFELVLGTLFVLWWTTLPRSPELMFGPADAYLRLAPSWAGFYLPVLVIALASILAKSVTLVRPDWTTFRFTADLVTAAAGLAMLAVLLRAGDLVLPGGGAESEALARVANWGLRISFVVAFVIIAISEVIDIRRFVRARNSVPASD